MTNPEESPIKDPPSTNPVIAYHFGPYRLLVADRILEQNGERIRLTPKVIDTLFVLVERAPQVVSKEELMQAVWPDVTVVESGLTRNLSALRKALEDSGSENVYFETIPRRGYRFLAEVTTESAPSLVTVPPEPVPVTPQPSSPWLRIAAGAAALIVLIALLFRPDRILADHPVSPTKNLHTAQTGKPQPPAPVCPARE